MLRDETTRYVREAARVLLQVGVFFSTWAILDNVSEAQISAGDARSKFPYAMPDGTRVDDIDDPTKSVAHTIESVGDMFKNAGLTFGHFRGSWTGLPGFHGQDILIADAT